MTGLIAVSRVLYRRLLFVCPKDLRDEYALEMTRAFEDELCDAWSQTGAQGIGRVWLRCLVELCGVALVRAAGSSEMIVAGICWAMSVCCFSAELALARAHVPAGSYAPSLSDAIRMVVIYPSLVAALVSILAVRVGARSARLSSLEVKGEEFHA